LVAREMIVPDAIDGKERWSLDHLFADQDAVLFRLREARILELDAKPSVNCWTTPPTATSTGPSDASERHSQRRACT
jgi:hypothetical protein